MYSNYFSIKLQKITVTKLLFNSVTKWKYFVTLHIETSRWCRVMNSSQPQCSLPSCQFQLKWNEGAVETFTVALWSRWLKADQLIGTAPRAASNLLWLPSINNISVCAAWRVPVSGPSEPRSHLHLTEVRSTAIQPTAHTPSLLCGATLSLVLVALQDHSK